MRGSARRPLNSSVSSDHTASSGSSRTSAFGGSDSSGGRSAAQSASPGDMGTQSRGRGMNRRGWREPLPEMETTAADATVSTAVISKRRFMWVRD